VVAVQYQPTTAGDIRRHVAELVALAPDVLVWPSGCRSSGCSLSNEIYGISAGLTPP
jgi:hypothetical protein